MLKTSRSIEFSTQSKEGLVGDGSNSRAKRNISKLDKSKLDGNEVDGREIEVDEVGKKVQKISKSKNSSKSKEAVGSSDFLTPEAKLAFIKLRQAFFKAPILYHFDLERHIQIETDVSGHTIGGVFS